MATKHDRVIYRAVCNNLDDLFKKHGIIVDFSIRGFYRPTPHQRVRQLIRSKARDLLMRSLP